jgi:hypothetical protein
VRTSWYYPVFDIAVVHVILFASGELFRRISFLQNLIASDFLARNAKGFNDLNQLRWLTIVQPNDILLLHGTPPWTLRHRKLLSSNTTLIFDADAPLVTVAGFILLQV